MGSWMWKKILKHRDRAKLFYMVDVRNGLKASFWYEKWSPMGRLIEILGEGRYIEMGIKEDAKVAECTNHRKKNHRFSMLNRVELEIEKIKEKLYLEEKDISLWRNEKDIYKKEFKTSETWQVVREKHQHCDWYKAIWFKHYTPKYSFILWVAMRDRLSTGSRMAQWDIGVNTSCSFCQDPLESIEHLFFQCSFTSLIWENLARGVLKDSFTARWSEIKRIAMDENQGRLFLFTIRYLFQTSVHYIWRERNRRRHGEQGSSHCLLTKLIEKTVRNKFYIIQGRDKKYEGRLQFWFGTR